MARFEYRPQPGMPDKTRNLRHDFVKGETTEVNDDAAIRKLRGHPFFREVEGAANTTAASSSASVGDLVAKHRGGGSYSIMRGDEEVKEGLSKADAEAFNGMSDEDKAAYVADEK